MFLGIQNEHIFVQGWRVLASTLRGAVPLQCLVRQGGACGLMRTMQREDVP
jgi:hypothetical protein